VRRFREDARLSLETKFVNLSQVNSFTRDAFDEAHSGQIAEGRLLIPVRQQTLDHRVITV
jgi:hypothetical protein